MAASVGVFLEILAGLGFIVIVLAGLLDLFEGAEQYVASRWHPVASSSPWRDADGARAGRKRR